MFGNFKTEGIEASKDSLGGFNRLPSGIYEGTIKTLFVRKLASGTYQATVIADLGDHGEYREQLYITNKEGKNYSEFNGKKRFRAGYTIVNDITLVTTGKNLYELEPEDRTFKIYDFDAKEEVPTSVPTIIECMGEEIALAITLTKEFKRKQDDSGEWVDTDETVELNKIAKVFYPKDMATVNERNSNADVSFAEAWLAKYKDQVIDKTESSSKAKPTQASDTPKKSLFK